MDQAQQPTGPNHDSMYHAFSGKNFEKYIFTLPKFNSSPLKNDGWKTILSFWDGKFSGAMLNFQEVTWAIFWVLISFEIWVKEHDEKQK